MARGIETWALDTAAALAARGVDVTLFAGAEVSGQNSADRGPRAAVCVLPCLRRSSPTARQLAALFPRGAWRWGLTSAYGWEQLSFWLRLWPRLRRARFDLLHVQDPMLAWWCRCFRRAHLVTTQEILAHGTEESAEFLAQFEYVQHLAPWHEREARNALRAVRGSRFLVPGCLRLWAVMPNFVDTERFRPVASAMEQRVAREKLGIPAEAFVVGCVAAVKKDHKRVDYLIREVAAQGRGSGVEGRGACSFLLIAGARTEETRDLEALAEETVPGRHRIVLDRPRDAMPELYRAMDVFVLPSLFEMMPIALLEALASGVPALAHRQAVVQWMIGEAEPDVRAGGQSIDMAEEGALARALAAITPAWQAEHGANARNRAVAVFARDVVVDQYMAYYRQVLAGRGAPRT